MKREVKYEYLPKQGQFMQNCREVPYSAYIGGFGSGKTHTLIFQTLQECATPSRGLLGAPTYKMLEDTTQKKFLDLLPDGWLRSFQQTKNKIILVNSTEVLCRSLEHPGRLAGLELDWFALDEIGEVKEDTFKMLQGRLRTGGSRHGFGAGNPAGPVHWTYEYFVRRAEKYPDTFRLVQATSYENTYNPKGYTKDMEISFGVDTPYYKTYVLGQFVAFEGAYWSNFDSRYYKDGGHVLYMNQVLSLLKGAPRFGKVIDFGFEHPFACLWYVTDGYIIIFFDEYHQTHGLIQWHCLQIKKHEAIHQQVFGAHHVGPAYTDHEAVSRAEIANCKDEDGNLIGFTCIPSEKRVMESILLVQTLFGQRRLFITDQCKRTLMEVPSYRSKQGVLGEEPLREEEDTCCCLRYACWDELNHTMPWKRYDTASIVPDDLYETQPVEY